MATVTFYLSRRVDQRGKSEILIRFVGGREHVHRLRSGLWVEPSRFRDGAVVVPRLGGPQQRELLDLRSRLEDIRTRLLDWFVGADPAAVTRDALQRVAFRGDSRDVTFFATWGAFVASLDVSAARLRRYAVVRGALERWQSSRGRDLNLDSLTAADIDDFRGWLLTEAGRHRSRNVVVDYLKALRAFWRWCLERGLTKNDPFAGVKIGAAVYGTPFYLTIDERDALYATDLDSRPALAAQRDVFIFQCLTGCRYGDLARFVRGDVVDGVLTYIPRKTGEGRPVEVRVPLTATAQEIVARYADLPGARLLPVVSNQKYNAALKVIFTAAGLDRPVTIMDPLTRREVKRPLCEVASSHLARRTFVGNLYRQVKDPALVGSLSGHAEGSRAFARYRTIDDDLRRQTVQLLEAVNGVSTRLQSNADDCKDMQSRHARGGAAKIASGPDNDS